MRLQRTCSSPGRALRRALGLACLAGTAACHDPILDVPNADDAIVIDFPQGRARSANGVDIIPVSLSFPSKVPVKFTVATSSGTFTETTGDQKLERWAPLRTETFQGRTTSVDTATYEVALRVPNKREPILLTVSAGRFVGTATIARDSLAIEHPIAVQALTATEFRTDGYGNRFTEVRASLEAASGRVTIGTSVSVVAEQSVDGLAMVVGSGTAASDESGAATVHLVVHPRDLAPVQGDTVLHSWPPPRRRKAPR